MAIEIHLKNVGMTVLVDDDQSDLSRLSWFGKVTVTKHCRYVYACCRLNGKPVYMHRLVLAANDGDVVDHINGNRLDNRKENLRICSHKENMRNRRPTAGRTLKQGVCLTKEKTFAAGITIDGKHVHLGTYKTEDEAHGVYVKAKKKYHGEFSPY